MLTVSWVPFQATAPESYPTPSASTVPTPGAAVPSGSGASTWDRTEFYVGGQNYQIVGRQIDPQRVPRIYGGERLQTARATGLNTIFFYLYWHEIEKHPGQFGFSDNDDVAAWAPEMQRAGMKAVLSSRFRIVAGGVKEGGRRSRHGLGRKCGAPGSGYRPLEMGSGAPVRSPSASRLCVTAIVSVALPARGPLG